MCHDIVKGKRNLYNIKTSQYNNFLFKVILGIEKNLASSFLRGPRLGKYLLNGVNLQGRMTTFKIHILTTLCKVSINGLRT